MITLTANIRGHEKIMSKKLCFHLPAQFMVSQNVPTKETAPFHFKLHFIVTQKYQHDQLAQTP